MQDYVIPHTRCNVWVPVDRKLLSIQIYISCCALPEALWWFAGKWEPQRSIHPPDKSYHCTWQLELWSQCDRNRFLCFTGMWTQISTWEDSSLAVEVATLVFEQLSFAGLCGLWCPIAPVWSAHQWAEKWQRQSQKLSSWLVRLCFREFTIDLQLEWVSDLRIFCLSLNSTWGCQLILCWKVQFKKHNKEKTPTGWPLAY